MLLISGIPKMSNLNKCELNIDQVYTEVLHFSLVKMVKTLEGPKQQEKTKCLIHSYLVQKLITI